MQLCIYKGREKKKGVRKHDKEKEKMSSLCYNYFLFFLTHRTAIGVVVIENDDIMYKNKKKRKKETRAALFS
jgi:hypothetical protein